MLQGAVQYLPTTHILKNSCPVLYENENNFHYVFSCFLNEWWWCSGDVLKISAALI